jgi:hypothetical protein
MFHPYSCGFWIVPSAEEKILISWHTPFPMFHPYSCGFWIVPSTEEKIAEFFYYMK